MIEENAPDYAAMGYVRRGVLMITAELLIELLEQWADGRLVMPDGREITLSQMPRGCRVVGVRVEHWGRHEVSLLIEGDECPWVMEGQSPQHITPIVEVTHPEAARD